MNPPHPSTGVSYSTEEHPPQYTPPSSSSKNKTKLDREGKHPILVQAIVSKQRRDIFHDKYGLWASTIGTTKRLSILSISPTWTYTELLNHISARLPEPKDRPLGTWSGAGIVEVGKEKLSVLWDGGEDFTDVTRENWEDGRVWGLFEMRGGRDMLRVMYEDLGPSYKIVARVEGGERGREKERERGREKMREKMREKAPKGGYDSGIL